MLRLDAPDKPLARVIGDSHMRCTLASNMCNRMPGEEEHTCFHESSFLAELLAECTHCSASLCERTWRQELVVVFVNCRCSCQTFLASGSSSCSASHCPRRSFLAGLSADGTFCSCTSHASAEAVDMWSGQDVPLAKAPTAPPAAAALPAAAPPLPPPAPTLSATDRSSSLAASSRSDSKAVPVSSASVAVSPSTSPSSKKASDGGHFILLSRSGRCGCEGEKETQES